MTTCPFQLVTTLRARIAKSLAQDYVSGTQYSRLIRQLKILSAYTGETIEDLAEEIRSENCDA